MKCNQVVECGIHPPRIGLRPTRNTSSPRICRFFPKFPDKELTITSVLFGSLIQQQLISYVPLVIALRYVLDALRQPLNSKMFRFGMYALEQVCVTLCYKC